MIRRLMRFGLTGAMLAGSMTGGICEGETTATTAARDEATAARGIVPPTMPIDPDSGLPSDEMARAIANWLSSCCELPVMRAPPKFQMVPAKRLISLRLRGVASERWAVDASTLAPGQVVAVYNDDDRIIYLPAGWTGGTPAEVSVVVHEMVHHLQNEAGLHFACQEVREEAAFAAQERWLGLFGTDLNSEFGIDPFTLLVRTNCPL
jgi:hypothetical protein